MKGKDQAATREVEAEVEEKGDEAVEEEELTLELTLLH